VAGTTEAFNALKDRWERRRKRIETGLGGATPTLCDGVRLNEPPVRGQTATVVALPASESADRDVAPCERDSAGQSEDELSAVRMICRSAMLRPGWGVLLLIATARPVSR